MHFCLLRGGSARSLFGYWVNTEPSLLGAWSQYENEKQ